MEKPYQNHRQVREDIEKMLEEARERNDHPIRNKLDQAAEVSRLVTRENVILGEN